MGGLEHFVGSWGGPAASVGVLGPQAIGQSAVHASLAKGRRAGVRAAAAAGAYPASGRSETVAWAGLAE